MERKKTLQPKSVWWEMQVSNVIDAKCKYSQAIYDHTIYIAISFSMTNNQIVHTTTQRITTFRAIAL